MSCDFVVQFIQKLNYFMGIPYVIMNVFLKNFRLKPISRHSFLNFVLGLDNIIYLISSVQILCDVTYMKSRIRDDVSR